MRITETQGQRESPMDRKSDRNPYRKKTRERGAPKSGEFNRKSKEDPNME